MIGIDLVHYNTKMRIINTHTAQAVVFDLPQGLTTGGVGLPAVADLVNGMNRGLQLIGLQFPDTPPANEPIDPDTEMKRNAGLPEGDE